MKSNRNVVLRHTLYLVYRMKRKVLTCAICGNELPYEAADMHHIINRRHLTREMQEAYPVELCVFLCQTCHLYKPVDTPDARARLLGYNYELFGEERVQEAFDKLSAMNTSVDLRRLFHDS